jgi:hypothetical protein
MLCLSGPCPGSPWDLPARDWVRLCCTTAYERSSHSYVMRIRYTARSDFGVGQNQYSNTHWHRDSHAIDPCQASDERVEALSP